MDHIRVKACGKINIALDVTGVRSDGYHLVRMVMQTVGISDDVTVKKAGPGIVLKVDDPQLPADRSNLAWKAAEKMLPYLPSDAGVSIDIVKRIPKAAGMAGGSADAAAVINAVNELYSLDLAQEELDRIAVGIGADVPFCLRRGTYLSEGIGEVLTKLDDMPAAAVLVVNPGFDVSTKQVYESLDNINTPSHPDIDGTLAAIKTGDLGAVCLKMGNILEDVTAAEYPQINAIKAEMDRLGSLKSLMTGSGPTVFGLFNDEGAACRALEYFKDKDVDMNCFLTGFIRG